MNPRLPRIALLGDSIRLGYESFVCSPTGNGRNTFNIRHAFSIRQGPESLPRPNGVHCTQADHRLLGQHLAAVPRPHFASA